MILHKGLVMVLDTILKLFVLDTKCVMLNSCTTPIAIINIDAPISTKPSIRPFCTSIVRCKVLPLRFLLTQICLIVRRTNVVATCATCCASSSLRPGPSQLRNPSRYSNSPTIVKKWFSKE